MLVSTRNQANDLVVVPASAKKDVESLEIIAVLEELLGQSIDLRDLYKNARSQTAGLRYHRLRQLLDRHYKEQLQLIYVLTDRIRILGGARQLIASKFLQGTRFACALRGNRAAGRMLRELLDAHESVLSAARPNGSTMDEPWTRDFAVGQVVLTNEAQSSTISGEVVDSDPRQRALGQHAGALLD